MYSISYIILFLVYALMALLYHLVTSETYRMWLKIASVVLFMLFFGFRGFVGDDWIIYYPNFDGMYDDNFSNVLLSVNASNFEPGFSFIQAFCKWIYPDYHFLVFVCCAINCTLLYLFIRKNVDNLPLAFMVFICMSGTELQINLLRNSMSILLCMNALTYLENRKPLQYFLICIIAMSIHISSVVFIFLYFIVHIHYSKWLYISLLLFATVFLLMKINFISFFLIKIASSLGEVYEELVRAYLEGEYAKAKSVISFGFIERLMTGILIFCYYDKLVTINKSNVIFINLFLLYYFSFAFFREFDIAARRVALLFVFTYWVIWCDLLKCFVVKGNKILFATFLICYGVLKVHNMTNEPKARYDNILFGAKSYEERYTIYMLTKEE